MEEYIKDYEWEVIFVNDGSTDRTGEILEELSSEDSCCRVIELSRNFGKEIALSAGVDNASGDAVICMDADLQHPPSQISEMLRYWEDGYEVVEMVRSKSEGEPLLRRIGSYLFYFHYMFYLILQPNYHLQYCFFVCFYIFYINILLYDDDIYDHN